MLLQEAIESARRMGNMHENVVFASPHEIPAAVETKGTDVLDRLDGHIGLDGCYGWPCSSLPVAL
jgi:hypothetical protein